LRFIRHARDLGFEVDAIRQLLYLASDPDRSCKAADAIAHQHLADIDEKIARLSALKVEVTRMIANCVHGSIGQCRVIEVLADHGQCECERH
jgi:DNA-binding transcriptional MerR regulator